MYYELCKQYSEVFFTSAQNIYCVGKYSDIMTTILFRRIRKDTWKLIIPKELKKLIIMPPKQSVVHIQESGWKSNPKLFKLALLGVFFAGVSYHFIKKYR